MEYRSQTGELAFYPKEFIIEGEKDDKVNYMTLQHGIPCLADVIIFCLKLIQ